jgi:hypothetical protein
LATLQTRTPRAPSRSPEGFYGWRMVSVRGGARRDGGWWAWRPSSLGFLGIRMSGQRSLSLTASTSVTLWSERRRGIALGLSSGLGQALMSLPPLVLAVGIGAFVGWRGTWLAAAAVIWVLLIPIAWFGLRDTPAELGQQLDGDPADPDAPSAADPATSWTRGEAMRTPIFWVVTAAVGASGMIGTGLAFWRSGATGRRPAVPC